MHEKDRDLGAVVGAEEVDAGMAGEQEIERPPQPGFGDRLGEARVGEARDLAHRGHLAERELQLLVEGARLQRGHVEGVALPRAPERRNAQRELGVALAGPAGDVGHAHERLAGLELQVAIQVLERRQAVGAGARGEHPRAGAFAHEMVDDLPGAVQHHDERCFRVCLAAHLAGELA